MFIFCGLGPLQREWDLRITPRGNPTMPMKLRDGSGWFWRWKLTVPTALTSLVPGSESMTTGTMRETGNDKDVTSIADLRPLRVQVDAGLFVRRRQGGQRVSRSAG